MVFSLFKRRSVSSLEEMDKKVSSAFRKVRTELDNHLDTINENTSEIDSNYAKICELDDKIEKLNEKIEELHMLLATASKVKDYVKVEPLTAKEEEVFLCLYTCDSFISPSAIAKKVGLSEYAVKDHIEGIIEKGVPIIKKCENKKTFLMLEPDFKCLQTTENVLSISDISIRKFRENTMEKEERQ